MFREPREEHTIICVFKPLRHRLADHKADAVDTRQRFLARRGERGERPEAHCKKPGGLATHMWDPETDEQTIERDLLRDLNSLHQILCFCFFKLREREQ